MIPKAIDDRIVMLCCMLSKGRKEKCVKKYNDLLGVLAEYNLTLLGVYDLWGNYEVCGKDEGKRGIHL